MQLLVSNKCVDTVNFTYFKILWFRDSIAFNSFTSPDARQARAELLKNILDSSSHALVAMASQLSEAEERERAFTGRARWEQLRTMGDAKGLLHYVFNLAIDARFQE